MNTSIYFQLILLNKNHNEHYLKRYVKLVSFYKERNWTYKSGLHHEHHIVPESFGGLDTKDNLVCITPREHFILHWMLYKAFTKSQMTTAFKSMCCCWGHMNFRVSSRVYQNAMIEFRENHHFKGGEIQRQTQNRRVKEGTNPFCNGEMSRQNNKKMFESGTHSFQIKIECEHCKKIFHKGNYIQWHGDKCKLNPLYKKDEKKYKPKPKFECPHCNRLIDRSNFTRYHGDKCKLKP